MRILIVCHTLTHSGALFRFERCGFEWAKVGHHLVFACTSPAAATRRRSVFPTLSIDDARRQKWDLTMIPGQGFPPETIDSFRTLRSNQFGVRIQHILNDTSRFPGFASVNSLFQPHVVIRNNDLWSPEQLALLHIGEHQLLEGAVDLPRFNDVAVFNSRMVTLSQSKTNFELGGLASKTPDALLRFVASSRRFTLRLFGPCRSMTPTMSALLKEGRLTLYGPLSTDQLPAFYRSLGCLVHLERHAGWANTVAEAMASYVPVICSRAGTGALARANETAHIVDPDNWRDVAATIESIADNGTCMKQVCTNAYKMIQRFSYSHYAEAMLTLCTAKT